MLLKPKSKKIKLIDFGLSRKLREDEIVKEMMGTPEFVGRSSTTLDPAYNEFGNNEHPVNTTGFLCCTKYIDMSVKKFDYKEYPPTTVQMGSVVTGKCTVFVALPI